jgi:hypothetical protein
MINVGYNGYGALEYSMYFHRISRETGVLQEEELESFEDIFDYVSEEDYSKLVQQRQRDDWILDDG